MTGVQSQSDGDRARRIARGAFAVAALIAIAMQFPVLDGADWSLFDTRIYLDGGHAVFHDPAALYTTLWQGGWLFTYPPFAAVLFGLLDILPAAVATGLLVGGSIVALARISFLVSRGIVERLATRWLVAHPEAVRDAVAFASATGILLLAIASEPVRGTIGFGQINILLAWLVVEDFLGWGTRRSWRAGVLTGIAAGIKITPALLLIPRLLAGDWQGARNGVLAGAATVAISAAVVPWQIWDYYTRWLWDTTRPGDPWYAWNQSLTGTAYRLAGEHGAAALKWLLIGLAAAAGLYVATVALRVGDRAGAVLLGSLTIYLVSPITWYHHLVLIPALCAWLLAVDCCWLPPWRAAIRVMGTVTVISAVVGLYKVVPSGDSAEFGHSAWESILAESFPLAGLLLLLVLSGAMASGRIMALRDAAQAPPTPCPVPATT